MHNEHAYYRDNFGVVITNARAILGNRTFAMANISSVTGIRIDPDRTWPVICIVTGVILLMVGAGCGLVDGGQTGLDLGDVLRGIVCAGALGVPFIGGGALWWYLQKTRWIIRVAAAGGEVDALWSSEYGYMQQVLTALNDAIIHRG